MAKTYRNLYPALCSFENLFLAWRNARRGKRGRAEVAAFEFNLESNLITLQSELRERRYRPGPYRSFHIHEPKRRLISAAPFRDRVVHHTLCQVIHPIFERRFIHDSYANRTGKGTHRALDRCTHFMRRHAYVLHGDVRQFFPSVDHELLRGVLARHIADPDVLWLIDRILDSGRGVLDGECDRVWFPGDDLWAASRPRGLPIGNLTSQLWANVYLHDLDDFVKRELKCRAYVRYVDDFLLFSDDRRDLRDWRAAIIDRLAALRLTLHEGSAQARPVTEGLTFLGFRLYPDHRRLKRGKVVYFRRRYRRLVGEYGAGYITLDRLTATAQGWANHARYGDTHGLRRAILSGQPLPRPTAPAT